MRARLLPIFSYSQYPASTGFLPCPLYFLVFSGLPYLFPKTAMKILRKYSRRKDENSAGRVTIIGFAPLYFPPVTEAYFQLADRPNN